MMKKGFGVSTCIGIGGDPIVGTSFTDVLELFEEDPHTENIVLIGEIGGESEEQAATFIANHGTKPVVAYVAGITAPPAKKMGHAGALIEHSTGSAEKSKSFPGCGRSCCYYPDEVVELLSKRIFC